MNDKIKEQILVIRNTGITNMFDVITVQRIAFEMDFYELVDFLENNRKAYANFIMFGDQSLKNKRHLSLNMTCYYVLLE